MNPVQAPFKQGGPLPVHGSRRGLTLSAVLSLEMACFEADWHGRKLPVRVAFALALDPHALFLAVHAAESPDCDHSAAAGSFVEGLWQRDVAELFIKEDASPRYQEFNLSPAGAWWSRTFRGYRQADEGGALPEGVETFSEIGRDFWRAVLCIPRRALSVRAAFNDLTQANVSVIVGGAARSYVSWAKISGEHPDFHKAGEYCCLGPIKPL